jgi:hypothetical protein
MNLFHAPNNISHTAAVLNLGVHVPLRGPLIDLKGVHELGWLGGGGGCDLFVIMSNSNLAFHSIKNVGDKAIYDLWTPNIFPNFNKSHLYFMPLKTHFFEGVRRFHRLSKGT